MPLSGWDGAVSLITGGASGIGLALARELSRRGGTVVLADIQSELAEREARELPRARAAELDVRDADRFETVVADVMQRHGRIDYFFNNAGTGTFGEVRSLTLEDWKLTLDVNLGGVVTGIRTVYPRMVAQGFGHIVSTASIAGLVSAPMVAPYAATKHAVVGLSKALRPEAERHGVRVSVLCPGVVRTPLLTGGVLGKRPAGVNDEQILRLWELLKPVDPEPFARDVLACVKKNVGVIVLPRRAAMMIRAIRMVPGLESALCRTALARVAEAAPELFAR